MTLKTKKQKELKYKFLRLVDGKIKSENGNCTWIVGKKKTYKGKISMCESGFHCSDGVYDAFGYVKGEVLAEVEVGGKSKVEDSKSVWSKMTIKRAWKWEKKDSVALSIYAAELCIENFENIYPDDKRPREAIEAAKKWLKNPTIENKKAAESAESAARSAARSAERSGIFSKIDKWMTDRISTLTEIK